MSETPTPVVIIEGREPRLLFRAPATYALIALNSLAFLLMTLADFSSETSLFGFLVRTAAGVGANVDLLLRFGASFKPFFRNGEYWRLVTPMFLHVGLVHFFLNNYALLVLGIMLERVYGYGRFAMIYVGSGLGSSALSMAMSNRPSAGASGAIFGILGAMLAAGYVHRHLLDKRWAWVFSKGILPVIAINLLLGLALHSYIDNWAHLGGLAGGLVLAFLIPPPPREVRGREEEKFQVSVLLPALVVVFAIGAAARNYNLSGTVGKMIAESSRFAAEKQNDRAIELLRRAQSVSPLDDRPHEALGELYLDLRRVEEAKQEFEEARRLNPLSDAANFGLAHLYALEGNQAKGREILKELERNLPPGADSQAGLAQLCDQNKLYAEAIEHYEQALRLKPDMAVAHNNLAWLLATCDDPKYRDPKRALEHARRAVELSGWKEAGFIDTLAEALYANRQFDEAVKTQEKALELEPNNQELQGHMARYKKAAGL